MRSCSNCHAAVPDAAESCPQCGNPVSRGFLSSLVGLFRGKAPSPEIAAPPPAAQPPRARAVAGAFRMEVADVFTITGRGTVVTGHIASGEIHVGDEVSFLSNKGVAMKSNVTGIEMFQKVVKEAKTGDHVGLLLRRVGRDDIPVGTTIERV